MKVVLGMERCKFQCFMKGLTFPGRDCVLASSRGACDEVISLFET